MIFFFVPVSSVTFIWNGNLKYAHNGCQSGCNSSCCLTPQTTRMADGFLLHVDVTLTTKGVSRFVLKSQQNTTLQNVLPPLPHEIAVEKILFLMICLIREKTASMTDDFPLHVDVTLTRASRFVQNSQQNTTLRNVLRLLPGFQKAQSAKSVDHCKPRALSIFAFIHSLQIFRSKTARRPKNTAVYP